MASVVPEADLWGCSLRVSLAPKAAIPANPRPVGARALLSETELDDNYRRAGPVRLLQPIAMRDARVAMDCITVAEHDWLVLYDDNHRPSAT